MAMASAAAAQLSWSIRYKLHFSWLKESKYMWRIKSIFTLVMKTDKHWTINIKLNIILEVWERDWLRPIARLPQCIFPNCGFSEKNNKNIYN
jgi:hypothetical protein